MYVDVFKMDGVVMISDLSMRGVIACKCMPLGWMIW